jgi:hypothetical protein
MGKTFRKYVHWNRLRRTLLEFLAPDPLTYSLTRRIFDDWRPGLDCFNWVGRHIRELALVAIDRPGMLPFLQHVDKLSSGSLLENFRSEMENAGMSPSAFRKLESWGHGCFAAAMESPFADWKEVMVRVANLLDRLRVQGECPPTLGQIATYGDGQFPPDWFMRAALVEVRRLEDEDPEDCCPLDVEDALAWLASKSPKPDENQRRAGWDWISAQAWKHRLATDAEAAKPWPVPLEECMLGNFAVVPIRSRVELREEGEKMSNCLATWGDACASGRFAVFSIRDAAGKQRIASFSLEKGELSWKVRQIAGKANAKVPEELQLIAHEVAARAR